MSECTGTLKEAVLRPPQRNLAAQQQAFNTFRREYNEERPHEALNQPVPGEVYAPSRRDFPAKLLEPEYPAGWETRRVRSNGEIRWGNQLIYLSEALIGQPVGLKPESDGNWTIYFMGEALGPIARRKAPGKILRASE